MNRKALIERIVKEYSDNPQAIADELYAVENAVNYLAKLAVDEDEKLKQFQKREAEFAARRKAIQDVCKHWLTTFHSDPAGDTSESYRTCDICGKEI